MTYPSWHGWVSQEWWWVALWWSVTNDFLMKLQINPTCLKRDCYGRCPGPVQSLVTSNCGDEVMLVICGDVASDLWCCQWLVLMWYQIVVSCQRGGDHSSEPQHGHPPTAVSASPLPSSSPSIQLADVAPVLPLGENSQPIGGRVLNQAHNSQPIRSSLAMEYHKDLLCCQLSSAAAFSFLFSPSRTQGHSCCLKCQPTLINSHRYIPTSFI